MSQPGTQSTSTSSDEVVEKSVRGAATTTLAGLLGRAAGLVTTLLVTHFVHKTEYGQANLALIIATVVNVLTLLAPQQALLTRRTLFAESSQIIQRFVVGSGVLVFGLLFGLGRPLLGLLHESGTLPLLQVYCAALFFERLALIPAVRLRYELRFSHLVQVDLLGDTVYVIVTMATAACGAGAICLPLGALLRQVARVLWLKFGLRMSLLWSDVQLPNAQTQTLRSELWQMMWPIYLASMVELSTLYMDNLFVGRVYSTGAQGIYAVGYTVMMTPCETIAMYATSALVRALGLDDRDRRQQNFLAGLRYVTLLLLPIATGAALVGPTFESALLPPRWHGIAQIMAGLSLGAVSLGFHRMAFAQLTALHKSRLAALVYATQISCFVLGLWLVARFDPQRLHMERTAYAVSGALLLAGVTGVLATVITERLRLSWLAYALGPALLGSSAMAVALAGLQWLLGRFAVPQTAPRLLVEVLLGMVVYGSYLRLCHPSLFDEVRRFIARRN